jgi:2TM domain
MPTTNPAPDPGPDRQDLRTEARRWVRRKRIFYTILGIYAALSLMWFLIDMSDGTENIWFYWPMLGTGIGVAITGVTLAGLGGLFGIDWEHRQIERYMRQRGSEG